MIVLLSSSKILMLFVVVCLSNGVTCTSISTTNDTISQTKNCDNDNKIQEYKFRYTSTGSIIQSGIQGDVLLTLDKKLLCTETTACKAELKSNEFFIGFVQ